MRSTAFVLVTLHFALSACGPEAPAEPVAETACPITAPVRLVAAPEGFEPAEDVWYGLHVFGDDILFTFDRFDDPEREYWRLNRCSGEIEGYSALAPGLHNPFIIETADGRVLYGNDDAGRPYVIDRFDAPGNDEPRPVPGLPYGITFLPFSGGRFVNFFLFWTSSGSDDPVFGAADIGAWTYAVYTHGGGAETPALRLSDRLLRAYYFDDTHSLIHEEGGEVHRISDLTGERELLLTGVRALSYGFDRRTFIWQALGDDSVEPVYLHDLATGEDVQIAVNDFAATSWNRNPERIDMGEWVYADHEDPAAAAMIGPGDRFVAAARLDTGEPVAVPDHLEQRGSFAGYFRLLLADESGDVEAFWDPLTGELRKWNRDLESQPFLRSIDGDLVEYFVRDPDDSDIGTLWRLDLAAGEKVPLLTDVGSIPFRINQTQYFVELPHDRLDAPPAGDSGFFVRELSDLKLVDIDSGHSTPIVDKVSGRAGVAHEGLVFIDAFGPEPGLWAYPLPYGASPSGSRTARFTGALTTPPLAPTAPDLREAPYRSPFISAALPPKTLRTNHRSGISPAASPADPDNGSFGVRVAASTSSDSARHR